MPTVQPAVYGIPRSAAIPYSQLVLGTPGLVGYWRLNEKTGTAAADQLGIRTLSASGTVTVGQSGPLAGGGSFLFGGGYLLAPSVIAAYSRLTVETWLRMTTTDGARHAIYGDRGTGTVFMTGPCIVGGGTVYNLTFEQDGGDIADGRGAQNQAVNDGLWHHVVGRIEGTPGAYSLTDFDVFVDGVEAATYSNETYNHHYNWPSTPAAFRIGQGGSGSYAMAGYLAEIAVYGRALTDREIASHAAAPRR